MAIFMVFNLVIGPGYPGFIFEPWS